MGLSERQLFNDETINFRVHARKVKAVEALVTAHFCGGLQRIQEVVHQGTAHVVQYHTLTRRKKVVRVVGFLLVSCFEDFGNSAISRTHKPFKHVAAGICLKIGVPLDAFNQTKEVEQVDAVIRQRKQRAGIMTTSPKVH
jgi:hypothetical protein